MTFTNYPFAADHEGNDANLGQQAEAHNQVEVAANQLQEQITSLQAQVDSLVGDVANDYIAFKALFDTPIFVTPTLVNVTVGAPPVGAAWMRYVRVGNLVFLEGGFRLGAGFTMHATNPVGFYLPFNAAHLTAGTLDRRPLFSAYANNHSSTQRTSGAGIVVSTEPSMVRRFANEATGLGWDAGSPYTWAVNDDMTFSGFYWTDQWAMPRY